MAAQVEAVGAGLEVRPHPASLAGVPVGDHGLRTGSGGVSAPSGITRGAAGLSHQARGGRALRGSSLPSSHNHQSPVGKPCT